MTSSLSQQLAERVRHCVPRRHAAFGTLLKLLSIEASDKVETAAVTVGTRSRLLLNPKFVATRCRTDAQLTMLVMHELYHVLLGHTRLFQRPTPAANWAFDCVINAQLCRQFSDAESIAFFAGLAAMSGPGRLLGPAPGWPASPVYTADALGDLHRRLYDDGSVTTPELFAALAASSADGEGGAPGGELIGNHGPEGSLGADPLNADPDLLAEVQRIVARWPREKRTGGRDDGGTSDWEQQQRVAQASVRRALRRLLLELAQCGTGQDRRRRRHEILSMSPLPQARDRRALVQRMLGSTPLLWHEHLEHESLETIGEVTVYLDVSGSVEPYLPVLLDTLHAFASLLRWPLYGFSTEVHDIDRQALAAGRYCTTGGTDIRCVVEHMLEHRIRRGLVVTDGHVGGVSDQLLKQLRQLKPQMSVALLADGKDSELKPLGWPCQFLPDIPLKPSEHRP